MSTDAWQPIETAPRDGTDIQLGSPGRSTVGHYFVDEGGTREHRDIDGNWVGQEDDDPFAGWVSWDGGFTEENPPTHWQPLPEPPSSETGQ